MNKYFFEDIPVSFTSNEDVIKNVFQQLLSNNEKNTISFINPEIFLEQEKNTLLHEYFLSTKYNFVDGVNLLYAINKVFKTSYGVKQRLSGTDFFDYLPEDKNISVFFYGAKEENCILAKEKIEEKYKNVSIVDYIDGYSKLSDEEIITRINSKNVDIVIVCLGCPKQENWIKTNFEKINAKIIFGNGGSIDFWSGKTKGAPVNIGNDCFIFSNVMIMPGVNIGNGAVVLPGSIVTKDVEPFTVVGGVPAKYIKDRVKEVNYTIDYNYWFAL